jgi:hypothetical protein
MESVKNYFKESIFSAKTTDNKACRKAFIDNIKSKTNRTSSI